MTSRQDSSKTGSIRPSIADVESLAGLFHPHAIEVQEFSHYALILDVRSDAQFNDDHVPKAVRVAPEIVPGEVDDDRIATGVPAGEGTAARFLPPAVAALVDSVWLDEAILVYCGRGGRDSLPLAKALRWAGWTADVLPGGYANYRRWVLAGLETLPRCLDVRVVTTALGSEGERVLAALAAAGQQVLNVATCAGWRPGALSQAAGQPTQAMFETRLLQELRQLDPRRPVWVAGTGRQLGRVSLPGALKDALAQAPTVALTCPMTERLARWCEDEPILNGPLDVIVQAVAAASPALEPGFIAASLAQTDKRQWLARLVAERDERAHVRQETRSRSPAPLPALVTDSLDPGNLLKAVLAWLPQGTPPRRG